VLDDFSLGRRQHLAQLEGRIEIIHDSLANIGRHLPRLAGVERVYHLAALISGYDSLKQPFDYLDANMAGLLHLLEACGRLAQQRPLRVMFASSSTVYGAGQQVVRSEAQQAQPITMYALSKYAGEHMLAMYQPVHGYDYVCLRLFNVYGPRQNPDHPYANVTCKFAHAVAHGSGVRMYGDGQQTRDFVFVDDVVEAFMRVSRPTPARIYNVGTGQDASIAHLLALCQRLGGVTLPVEHCPPWPNDIRAIRADATRLHQDTGFAVQVSLEDGLRRTIDYFRDERR
jgi:nucleoside-diphosphate-sugar epimerase